MVNPAHARNYSQYQVAPSRATLRDIIKTKFRELPFDIEPEQYEALSDPNKTALVHLVRATEILNSVYWKMDHSENIGIRNSLVNQSAAGNEKARHALKLFDAFNGHQGLDLYDPERGPLNLIKGKFLAPGKAFYPQRMTVEKLRDYLLDHPEQAAAILSNNTIVRESMMSEGDGLIAEPYSVAFRKEMRAAAKELLAASRATDHEDLSNYLSLQAQALVNDSDPEAVYKAERAWVELEDSPLEFTIGRESYEDGLSAVVANDPDVKAMLDANGIKAKKKDTFGARVGIVNQEKVQILKKYRDALPAFTKSIPRSDEYAGGKKSESKMTFADVDLVAVSGRYRAARSGITLAQNLPNDDKLSYQMHGTSRLVFHRSVRQARDLSAHQKMLDVLLTKDQHHLYDNDIKFEFTIGHEMAHSAGPALTLDGRDKKTALGKWGDIIEENKADMGGLLLAKLVEKRGDLSSEDLAKLVVTWAVSEIPAGKPTPDMPHAFRSVMQLNYFVEQGAIEFDDEGKMVVNIDGMIPAARAMLGDVIDIQLEGDAHKAQDFALKYGAWNDRLDALVEVKNSIPSRRFRKITTPFADKLLANDI